jgi:hypothetical protein
LLLVQGLLAPFYYIVLPSPPNQRKHKHYVTPLHPTVTGADDDEAQERELDSHRQPLQLVVEQQQQQQQRQMAMNTEREPDSHVLLVREATAHYRLNPKVRIRQYHRLLPSDWPRLVFTFPLIFWSSMTSIF